MFYLRSQAISPVEESKHDTQKSVRNADLCLTAGFRELKVNGFSKAITKTITIICLI